MKIHRLIGALALAALTLTTSAVYAETSGSRFGAGGYARIMTRPDFQGGDSRLGYWNLYGRLLNEGPYAALELRLDVLPPDEHGATWTSVHAKVEGGSVQNADLGGGSLANFRLSQLYARAGNVLLPDVTWQIGTLENYWGDLGLYDMRLASILSDTVGLSARYDSQWVELLLGFGDSGYAIKGFEYNTVLTTGGSAKLKLGKHAQIGVGGQMAFEPAVEGNRFAPHRSVFPGSGSGVDFEQYWRGEVAETFFEAGGQPLDFAKPIATSATSWKAIGHVGFGNLGPLLWNNLFANFQRRHPETFVSETYQAEDWVIYISDLTDERYELNFGNEMQLRLWPDVVDLTWAVLYGFHYDNDNQIAPSDRDRRFVSAVGRFQVYFTRALHLLLESSVAQEHSTNGNVYRNHRESIFQGADGLSDTRGLEFGDSDTRNTFQLKVGPVLNPQGRGIFNRPSFRLMYGAQHSSQNNAFGNSFVVTLDQYDDFETVERHWHHVVALEVETWF